MQNCQPTAPPTIAQALSLLLLVFLLMLLSSLAVTFALGVDFSSEPDLASNQLAIIIIASMLISYLSLWLITKNYYQQRFLPSLIIQPRNLAIAAFLGLATALMVLQLQSWFPAPAQLDNSISVALGGDTWALVLIYISVIAIAPIAEEYLFRGILFDSLYHQWGLLVAVLLSAFIFTLFHLFEYHQYWVAWFAVFCLAVMLAIMRHKSQSMLNPIALHATY